jgi:DNA-binding transcriptional LysR family regulator
MNLRSIDLNLLVVLDALLDEAHVSRAADRLGLSQPATSSALERCRYLFDDPLLERGKGMMRLTPKAEGLRVPLKNILSAVTTIIQPPVIDLMTLSQTVRVVMADLPANIVAGPLHRRLAETAPNINLVVQPWHGASEALDALAKGTIDLASSVFPSTDVSFRRKELLQEKYAVLMRKDHPAAKDFNLDTWLEYPHIVVSGRGDTRGALDDVLMGIGRTRRVGVVVPSFLMVAPLLAGSDLIGMLPSRGVPNDSSSTLAVFEPPIAVAGFPLHLAWHMRRDSDPAVQHVAQLIQQILH